MKYLQSIDGAKTYGFAVALAVLAVCELAGLVPAETKDALFHLVVSGIAASLRHAVSKLPAESLAKWRRVDELVRIVSLAIGPLPPEPSEQTAASTHVMPRDLAGSACLLLLLWPAFTMASENVRIVGPSGVPAPGYPVDLYVQGDLPEGTKITWDYFPKGDVELVEPKDGGRLARINTMSGTFKFIVSVTPPGDAPGVIRYHDLTVPGVQYVPPTPPLPVQPVIPIPVPQPTPPQPNPAPTPQPIPPVNPDPTFPPGQFQLAEATYRLAVAVNSPNRRGETLCLAGKVQGLITTLEVVQLNEGTISPQAIVQQIGGAFDECLPSPAWDDCRNRFTDRVAKLYQAGQLRTAADWQTMAEEALQGLNAAAAK